MPRLPRHRRMGKPFDRALRYALELHRKQARKGKDVPYAAHLLGVAATVLDFGGDEEQAMAGLLHDAAEDHGGRPQLARIRRRFGPAVARMVDDCTDTYDDPKPPWRPRKQAYLDALAGKDRRSLLVSASDKLDNARAIVADLRVHGPATLERFHGKQETVWYFRELSRIFATTDVGPIAGELAAAVREMARLARPRAVAGRRPRVRDRLRRPAG